MFEVRIIRSDNKYHILVNNEKIIYGIRTNTYFTQKFNFFNYSNSSPIAACKVKKSFFFTSKRGVFFDHLKTEYQISTGWAYYSLNIHDSIYSIRYGIFKIKGFFLNDIKVGEIEILKAGNLDYDKRIVFFEKVENYLPFIFLFISVDHYDFN